MLTEISDVDEIHWDGKMIIQEISNHSLEIFCVVFSPISKMISSSFILSKFFKLPFELRFFETITSSGNKISQLFLIKELKPLLSEPITKTTFSPINLSNLKS